MINEPSRMRDTERAEFNRLYDGFRDTCDKYCHDEGLKAPHIYALISALFVDTCVSCGCTSDEFAFTIEQIKAAFSGLRNLQNK